jgi:predicted flap endonuclease-1-like 5' DNA nuclease
MHGLAAGAGHQDHAGQVARLADDQAADQAGPAEAVRDGLPSRTPNANSRNDLRRIGGIGRRLASAAQTLGG